MVSFTNPRGCHLVKTQGTGQTIQTMSLLHRPLQHI